MKKISLILTFIMLVSVLSGCGGKSNGTNALPDWMSGIDAAKLLLANERLNAQLLKNDGDIFENGVEVMTTLAETAISNLNVQHVSNNSFSVSRLSTVRKTSTVLTGDYSGKVEITGDTFIFSEFEENNNSYDYFKNITENIVFTAELGAKLIDDVKKNVRVVDKWVDVYGTHYYLHVDENSEILCEKDTLNNTLNICKRYKNEDGKDVYELYSKQENVEERMTYIPGERYELSMLESHGDTYFVADNGKGYWETYIVGANAEQYNVSYFVMKNDICYDAFYDPQNQSIPLLKIMSSDRATDILNFFNNEESFQIDIKFSGFDGVKSVVAPSDSVEYNAEIGIANLSNGEIGKVHLTNGMVLNYGDSFVNGNVHLNAIHVGYTGGFGYIGEMSLTVAGETYAERIENLKSFLNETGLQCRRDIDSVLNGINKAYSDLESVIKYYKWNGISVIDETDISNAINKEKARFSAMEALYTAVKDMEVLDISDTELIELNINFAPITESSFDSITLDNMKVSLAGASLTIEDTTLFVKDEPYKVAFALADSNGKLVHFDTENTQSIKYSDENKFTVTVAALDLTLPVLSAGNYTFVTYIATSDGVRASAYTPVKVNETINMPTSTENMNVSSATDGNGVLTLTYEQIKDFTVSLTTQSPVGYEEFKTAVSEIVFEYGIPSDIIEIESDESYTALTGNETEIVDGTYRISYKVENGDIVTQGYVYVQYSCE